jgi:hypothetical protein
MPGKRSKTIEEQVFDLEMKKARIRADSGTGQTERLLLDIQIQELRDLAKRQE